MVLSFHSIRTISLHSFSLYSFRNGEVVPFYKYDDEEEEENQSSNADSENEDSEISPSFPELDLLIFDAINRLGGSVFPKLDWSSPKVISYFKLSIMR